ncbi:signal peptide peptidase-like 2B isoform X1 [Brachionus plicatilis]|uniref:Signal peptide peptidase-like 2B isoform X1 n=1 Tax=Brachionus plicatilis TaxID=10195 RepID=A0A3M7PY95_BRAPC|nr:signal peptide peptidase-like 2B isoform X1 [Brachionus plicatilis]
MTIRYFLLFFLLKCSQCDLVILKFRHSEESLDICALKKPIPQETSIDKELKLVNLVGEDACQPFKDGSKPNTSAYYLHVPTPRCSFTDMATNIQEHAPKLVILGTDGPISINTSLINLTASYVFMADEFAKKVSFFLEGETNLTVVQSDLSRFDGSLLVIWAIASLTIIFGGIWTRHEFNIKLEKPNSSGEINQNFADEINDNQVNSSSLIENEESKKDEDHKHSLTISVGYWSILVLLIFVVGMLLMLYYFFDYMIYVIYAIFCLGAASSIYRIGCLVIESFEILKYKLPTLNLPLNKKLTLQPAKVFLTLISISICILWFIFRHEEWSWSLQNVMALSLAANALSFYRLSKYKTVTIILVVFFLYDIFMVFITPTFTKGTSIMEAVAFGGKDASASSGPQDWSNLQFGNRTPDTSNRLPVVIIIPHLNYQRRLCSYYYDFSFSLLGLGDILVPGLSVNYAIIFDRAIGNSRFPKYFIINVIGYIIGLLLAFMGLLFMNMAQPALLYLCPILLIFSFMTALISRELKLYWSGEPISTLISQVDIQMLTSGQKTDEENAQG